MVAPAARSNVGRARDDASVYRKSAGGWVVYSDAFCCSLFSLERGGSGRAVFGIVFGIRSGRSNDGVTPSFAKSSRDRARRIAANIAKLPGLLRGPPPISEA